MLRGLAFPVDPNILVGLAEPDDAAVVRLSDELALVFTTDFFTPVVDDPRDFGRIAAANALSDVYAMGAKPLVALNIAAFPSKTLPLEILAEILLGGAEIAREAGISVAGGHTIDDPEPKYGLAVIGTVHPVQVWRKGGARPGDALVLTKALGTGILSTALKRGRLVESSDCIRAMIASMTFLNAAAASAARTLGIEVHAATDVTGYGLAGHLLEMLRASGNVRAVIDARALQALPEALVLADEGFIAGGTKSNREHVTDAFYVESGVSDALAWLAVDAQTSGGLLFAVPRDDAHRFAHALRDDHGVTAAAVVGEIEFSDSPRIVLRG